VDNPRRFRERRPGMCLDAGWARTRSRPRLDLKASPPRSQSPRSRPTDALSRVCSCLRKRPCAVCPHRCSVLRLCLAAERRCLL